MFADSEISGSKLFLVEFWLHLKLYGYSGVMLHLSNVTTVVRTVRGAKIMLVTLNPIHHENSISKSRRTLASYIC